MSLKQKDIRINQIVAIRLGLLIFLLMLYGCTSLNPGITGNTGEIIKSDTDTRAYRTLVLQNRMQVLLISDPDTDQAAAAMDVAVGQFSDPPDRQGLAHFLEHMLFLGTDKYPDADDYGSYLSTHGGYSNAFTGLEDTNYFFSIHKDYLKGALDRFSQFFISPRFDARFAAREINAVNSEHQKNINSDQRRILQILRNTANPDHPFRMFGTGNLESLGGGDGSNGKLRDQLINFYENHYSANLMKLVILGRESLDELEQMAKTHFSAVPDRDIQQDRFADRPVLQRPLGRKIKIQPVKSIRQLKLMFPIASQTQNYAFKSAGVLSHLLGDEGKGSILAYLKTKGLATSLSAGTGPDSRGFGFINITISLTPEGLEKTDHIVTTVFRYLAKLRRENNLERYFHESRKISTVAFRFKEKEEPSNYVSRLAMNMQDVPVRHILVSPWLHETYRPDLTRELLQDLTPDNLQVVLIAPGLTTDLVDPWYGSRYSVERIADEKLQGWAAVQPHPDLFPPPPNPFIVENVTYRPGKSDEPFPVLMKLTDRTRVWFKHDNVFKVPRGNIRIRLATPDAYATAKNAAMTKLFTLLLKERLNEFSYPAVIAGLHYSMRNSVKGIEFSFSGYSENLDILFRKVIEEIKRFKIDEDRFRILKNQMIENRQNMKLSQAVRQVGYETIYLLSTPFWHTDEYLAVTGDISKADLEAFIPTLLSRLHIDMLAHGNFQVEEVSEMATYLEQQLQLKGKATLPVEQTMNLPEGDPLVYQFKVPDVNSAIEVYYQAGPESIERSVTLDVIQQMIEKPFYHQLRTIEQLGYIVWSGYQNSANVDGFMFIIQSNVKEPVYLQSRIERFIAEFEGRLEQMSDEEFAKYKETLIAKRREAPKNLQEETQRYWGRISSGRYDFDRRETEIKVLQDLGLDEVRELFKKVFINKDSIRKVTVQAVGSVHQEKKPTGRIIREPQAFKKQMTFHPNPDGEIKS